MTGRHANPAYRIWRWPLAIGALSIFGLLSALLGQGGVWWILSWLALSIPLFLFALGGIGALGRRLAGRLRNPGA